MESTVPVPPDPGEAEEQLLIGRARARDQAAYRVLVERYRNRIYLLTLRMTRQAPEAEEAAQDAFVKAWLALPRFRGESRFSTWLHRIAARCALDRLAAMKRRAARETDLAAADAAHTATPGPGGGEDARRLERLMAALPEAQRMVITLFYHQDRSVEEVAQVLQMPTGTVKTHLSRGRAALREAWLREERGA